MRRKFDPDLIDKVQTAYENGTPAIAISRLTGLKIPQIRWIVRGCSKHPERRSAAAQLSAEFRKMTNKQVVLMDKVNFWWSRGYNTFEIARIVYEKEPVIYNILPMARLHRIPLDG